MIVTIESTRGSTSTLACVALAYDMFMDSRLRKQTNVTCNDKVDVTPYNNKYYPFYDSNLIKNLKLEK